MKRKKFGFTCYLLFICTIFIMCSTNSNNITEKDISMNQITYEKQVWGSNPSDLTCSIGNVSNFYIDDKLAFEIGIAVLKRAFGEDILLNLLISVIESLEENIYIIIAKIPGVLGGGYSVVLDKQDGRIIRISMGE